MIRLLDVNVLVALAWPNHVHHARAHRWFSTARRSGWATCPLTQSGFVRVSSNSRAIPDSRTPSQSIGLLREMCRLPGHVFWKDGVSAADPDLPAFSRVVGYRQVTDAHLLTLARHHGGQLATFDRGILQLTHAEARDVDLIP